MPLEIASTNSSVETRTKSGAISCPDLGRIQEEVLRRTKFKAAVIALAVFGCAVGKPFESAGGVPADSKGLPPEGKAIVYVYSPRNLIEGRVFYKVYAGMEALVSLKYGGYRTFVFEPGEYEFQARTMDKASVTKILKPGETYYLRGTIGSGPGAPPILEFVDRVFGASEIVECRELNRAKADPNTLPRE